MNINKVIAITGKATHGKSYLAKAIQDAHNEAVPWSLDAYRYSLANPLKTMVLDLLQSMGCPMVDDYDKTQPIDNPYTSKRITLRKAYQLFGTEFVRELFGQDYWAARASEYIHDSLKFTADGCGFLFVIDDVRFDNEAEYLRKAATDLGLDFELIKVIDTAKSKDAIDSHASEQGVSDCQVDMVATWSSNFDTMTLLTVAEHGVASVGTTKDVLIDHGHTKFM